MVVQPTKTKLANLFSILTAYSKHQNINQIKKNNIKNIVINPNSSAITDIIKSVSLTGKNFKCV